MNDSVASKSIFESTESKNLEESCPREALSNYLNEEDKELNSEENTNEEFLKNVNLIVKNLESYSEQTFVQTLSNISNDRNKTVQVIEKSFEFSFHKALMDIIKNTSEKLISYLSSGNEKLTKNELYLLALKFSLNIARSFSNNSSKFRMEFQAASGVKLLFNIINNEILLNAYIKAASNHKSFGYNILHSITRGAIGVLLNLSRSSANFKEKWNECNSVEDLLKFADKVFNLSDNKISAYITLANIADDDQIDKLPKLAQVIPAIVKLIGSCAEKINSKAVLKRMAIQLDENSDEIKDICSVNYLGTIWHLVELIDSLYHMAVNDKIKFDIYETHLMKDHLRTIIYKGNDTEVYYALKLLHQLCFDERILQDVCQDKKLFKFIKNLKVNQLTTNEVQKQSAGILWMIDKKPKSAVETKEKEIKQIMISYNRESRDLILRIKKELESTQIGFKIWIDVESIHGSSLESMAQAIEESHVVIVGMTENYKMSTFCRAEAEYAFQLNKKIVPLILQPNYQPDGWLGIILGSKIFVNFTKYEFSECMRRLREEINSMDQSNKQPVKPTKETESPNQNHDVLKWSETEVEEWLAQKKINSEIVNNVKPCNGVILQQLHEMMNRAPEFFYSSITSGKALPTRDVAVFT